MNFSLPLEIGLKTEFSDFKSLRMILLKPGCIPNLRVPHTRTFPGKLEQNLPSRRRLDRIEIFQNVSKHLPDRIDFELAT